MVSFFDILSCWGADSLHAVVARTEEEGRYNVDNQVNTGTKIPDVGTISYSYGRNAVLVSYTPSFRIEDGGKNDVSQKNDECRDRRYCSTEPPPGWPFP